MMMSDDDPSTRVVRRFEVSTGAGRRREWPPEVKAAIVAESYSGLETVCAVARRHGLDPSQLFAWRQQLRKQLKSKGLDLPSVEANDAPVLSFAEGAFVPAVIESFASSAPPRPRRSRRRRRAEAAVELEIDGALVKIARGADAHVISAVIEALKRAR